MKYLRALHAMAAGIRAAIRQALFTRAQLIALADRPELFTGLFVAQLYQNRAHDEVKTTDVWVIEGEPVVVETWLFTYADGQTDSLQRRHPVTDPAQRAIFLEDTQCE